MARRENTTAAVASTTAALESLELAAVSAYLLEALKWFGATGSAVLIGWIVNRRKIEGEAKQATGAGVKSEAEGQVVLLQEQRLAQLATLQQTREAAAAADEARKLAQQSEEVCLHEKRRVVLAFDQFINDVEEILAEPDADTRARLARLAISRAREAI